MRETTCQFGPHGQLAGIITEPSTPGARAALVLVSAGLVPKCGPFRLYARLARRLAQHGIVTLRFDLGGIGDSPAESTGVPLRVRTDLEIEAALAYLTERYAVDRIMLGGLCSGAADSFRYAEHDLRVKGVVLIDPFGYATWDSRWRFFVIRTARRVLRALGLYVPVAYPAATLPTAGSTKGKRLIDYKYMEYEESSRILRAMIDRGGSTHFVYTGGLRRFFNHPRQLKSMFRGLDFKGLVTVDHFLRIDHTQFLEEEREAVVEAIAHRLAAPA